MAVRGNYKTKRFQDLHYKCVFVPADKVSNNVIIIWRLHYIDVLSQEIINTKSYISIPMSEGSIILEHISMCEQLRADVKITQHKLPTMYWIPKLHKRPYKTRFIAYSSYCISTKHLLLLTSCLTKINDHVKPLGTRLIRIQAY